MRCLPVLAALLCSTAWPGEAPAQVHDDIPLPLTRQASAAAASSIAGVVTDEDGERISGAAVLAMGSVVTAARTDVRGRFHLSVPPGRYILRATRDGYISTYREAVQVRTDVPLTRNITLLKTDGPDIVLASMAQPVAMGASSADIETSPVEAADEPSESVWRLRHLPRTVLRDQASIWDEKPAASPRADLGRNAWTGPLAAGDLYGHVDFLTTSALTASGEPTTADWPRGVAYVVVGAPVGGHGDWTVRASLAGGPTSAWTFTGEYASNPNDRHSFRTGASYSAQTIPGAGDAHALAAIDTVRRVGGVHFFDRWTLARGLQVDSGFEIVRYDYLAEPTLVNGRLGVRQLVFPRVTMIATAASRHVAPGADQFAPPVTSGAWLPPERTFSALTGELRPQHVTAYEVGADTTLAGEDDLVLRLRRFSERSSSQIATIFGLDEASQVGHYYISSPGDVALDGWVVGISSRLIPHVRATVDYTMARADWAAAGRRAALWSGAASAVRSGTEQLHDVTAMIDADVPTTATRVTVALRLNSGFSSHQWRDPALSGRFAVDVRQQLPVRSLGQSELNLILSARTLLHSLEDRGGFYDELLTVAPPVRLMCGLQMRF